MRGGVRAWSKETGLGPVAAGLHGFKSHPPHHYVEICWVIREMLLVLSLPEDIVFVEVVETASKTGKP